MRFLTSSCPEQPDIAARVALIGMGFGERSPKSLCDAMIISSENYMKGKAKFICLFASLFFLHKSL